jgi:hypothetical protein
MYHVSSLLLVTKFSRRSFSATNTPSAHQWLGTFQDRSSALSQIGAVNKLSDGIFLKDLWKKSAYRIFVLHRKGKFFRCTSAGIAKPIPPRHDDDKHAEGENNQAFVAD